LRFKSYTNIWAVSCVEKMAKVYDGTHQTPDYTTSGVRFVSVENINALYESTKFISRENYKRDFKTVPQKDDILMTRIGDIGTPALITKDEPLAYYVSLALLKVKNINSTFLYYYIQTSYFQKELWRRTLHIAFPKKINKNEIGDCQICYTIDLAEQTKISNFLDLIEKRIAIQNKIISKYETLIKGLCNCLLAELEQYPKIPLSNILVEYNEKTTADNEYPILSSTMNGIFIQTEYFNKQAASEKTIGYKKIPYGYCTYRSMSDTGEFHFNLQKVVEIGIVSPAYPVFTSDSYNIDFVAFYLNNSNCLKKQIIGAKAGGTRFALSYSKLLKLFIPDIDKKRQERVVMIYDSLLYKLDVELLYLKKIKEQKQYLLSQMFI